MIRRKRILSLLLKISYHCLGKNKLYSDKSDLSCSPFFIVGTGRNGSTLLSMILNGHSKIFIPNEQYALHYAAIRYQLYNFLIWRDIVKIVIGEFADSCNTQNWKTDFNNLYKRLYDLPKNKRSFQKIIDEIVLEHSKQKENPFTIWGDKSVPTIWFLDYVYRIYPKSKYIFLIRDGRDVVSSFHRAGKETFGDLSKIENAAKNWKNAVKRWNWLKKRAAKHQLLEIRYETLVTEPEIVIKEVVEFLGLEFEEGMLNFKNVVVERNLFDQIHSGLSKPINKDHMGAWEEYLTQVQLDEILPIIKKELRQYNYL